MRIAKAISILALITSTLFIATPASAQAWQRVYFRMGAPAKYWLSVAACENGNNINDINWRQTGIEAGGLSIQHNGKFGEPNMGVWEQYGGEQFADSPDKATMDEQIIVANRIAITGFKKLVMNKYSTEYGRASYKRDPIGFKLWSCVNSKKVKPYHKVLYSVNLPTDPSMSCPRYENMFRKYGLPVKVFSYIAYRESKCNPGAVNAKFKNGKLIWTLNSNRTYDSGLLQINSSWFGTLKRETGYTSNDLFKAEVNAMFASWILNNTSSRLGNWSLYAR